MNGPGVVYLVGAGPGDPGLITRKGAALLGLADVVVHDHLANTRLLELAPPGALIVSAGKSSGHCTLSQDEIERTLIQHARQGKRVVRLKGGDPFLFGRGGEEALALRSAGIPYEIVPGVTAGLGATAYAGIPVTHRGMASAVAFVTGHADPEAATAQGLLDWEALARFPGTLVVYMGVTNLGAICRALVRMGKAPETPAAVIQSGATPWQKTVTGRLDTITDLARAARITPPALLVVGAVVSARELLAWYERGPFFGQRIVITRPHAEAEEAASELEALGAEVLQAPAVEIRALDDLTPLDQAIARLADYDWIVFASANGVSAFMERLAALGLDARAFARARIAVIGSATARALQEWRLVPDVVPQDFRSEGVVAALKEHARDSAILLVRASRGRDVLERELANLAKVDRLAAYQNVDAQALPQEVIDRVRDRSIDWVTFTSSAIATRFLTLLPEDARQALRSQRAIASLSPVTSQTIRQLGFEPAVEAASATWDALVLAIAREILRRQAESDVPDPSLPNARPC